MIKEIQVSCPGVINLFFNINGYDEKNNDYIYTSVNQMIDLYDIVGVTENHFDEKGIFIKSNDNIPLNEKNSVYKMAKAFLEYTNIDNKHLVISIKKNIPLNSGLCGKNSDAVGALLALNSFYNTGLSGSDLLNISSKVNKFDSALLLGGLSKIDGEKINALYNYYFNSFIIVKPKDRIDNNKYDIKEFHDVNYDYKKIYNSLDESLTDDLKKLRDYLLNKNITNHSLIRMSNNYMIAFPEEVLDNSLVLDINRNFPRYKLLIKKRTDDFRFFKAYK